MPGATTGSAGAGLFSQPAFDQDVLSESPDGNIFHQEGLAGVRDALAFDRGRSRRAAEEFGGHVGHDPFDDAAFQGGPVEGASSLEEDAVDFFLAQLPHEVLQVQLQIPGAGDPQNSAAPFLQGGCLPRVFGAGRYDRGHLVRGLNDPGGKRGPQVGVTDDPGGVFAVGKAAGQQGIVGQDCADADHDPAEFVPELLHMGPGLLPGHPPGQTCVGGDLAVHGHGVFHDHIGPARDYVVKKHFIGLVTFRFQDALCDLDSVVAQDADALARDDGVGVPAAEDDTADPRLQDGIGAGRLPPMVAAGLQSDVHGRPGRGLQAVFQGIALRVQVAIALVVSLPDHGPVLPDNDRTDHGIGGYPAASSLPEFKRHAHICLVCPSLVFICLSPHIVFPPVNG